MLSHGQLGDVRWRKSSKSEQGSASCVAIALVDGLEFIRDSKDPEINPIILSHAALRDFLRAAKSGMFDL